jgi:hypothetical protein
MKERTKNVVVSLLISGIVTGIIAIPIFILYNGFTAPVELTPLQKSTGVNSFSEQSAQEVLYGIIVFLVVVFCISTILSYIVIERLRKRKKIS